MGIKKVELKDGSYIGIANIKFYSFAATYLVNNDTSGLHDEEIEDVDMFYSNLEKYARKNGYANINVIDCKDNTEFSYPELFNGLRGDVITYTVHFYK